MRRWMVSMAIGLAGTAAAAAPWDPRPHRTLAGRPSEVLVLGSPHLSELPPTFRNESLAPLLDRLAVWKPEVIAIENLSPEQCDLLRRFPGEHDGAAETYCWDPAPAAAATGLDVPTAVAEVRRQLSAWPAAPTAAQRRRLAASFLASGDRASALVQWLRLSEAERRAGDGLDTALVKVLETARGRANESYQVAAVLAARLGLERVHPVDDHTADGPPGDDDAARAAAMKEAWSSPGLTKRMASYDALKAGLGTPAATLAFYRALNDPGQAQIVFDTDFGAAMRHESAGQWGRRYGTWWEVRNLRMVANLAQTFMDRPGARVLAIVGASHKGYYEAYLDMLNDVRIADTLAVLK